MKELEIGLLADFYGAMLKSKSKDIVDRFYNQDMSLGEIAKDLGITRQGVRDYLARAKKSLLMYEQKLGLAKKFFFLKQKIADYKHGLDAGKNKADADSIKAFLDNIAEQI